MITCFWWPGSFIPQVWATVLPSKYWANKYKASFPDNYRASKGNLNFCWTLGPMTALSNTIETSWSCDIKLYLFTLMATNHSACRLSSLALISSLLVDLGTNYCEMWHRPTHTSTIMLFFKELRHLTVFNLKVMFNFCSFSLNNSWCHGAMLLFLFHIFGIWELTLLFVQHHDHLILLLSYVTF